MNNDLISRSELKKAIKEEICNFELPISANEIMPIIDNAPTVDVSKEIWNKSNELLNKRLSYLERPQGEWIMNKTSARGRNYTCTNCQKVSRNKFDFCPKCGAYMRGGRQ